MGLTASAGLFFVISRADRINQKSGVNSRSIKGLLEEGVCGIIIALFRSQKLT